MRKLLVLLAALAPAAQAAPFLVSDPTTVDRVTHCVLTRAGVSSESPVEVVTGGKRCKIDLASDPKTGTVTVAFKDQVLGDTGPSATFSFPPALQAPQGMRLAPN